MKQEHIVAALIEELRIKGAEVCTKHDALVSFDINTSCPECKAALVKVDFDGLVFEMDRFRFENAQYTDEEIEKCAEHIGCVYFDNEYTLQDEVVDVIRDNFCNYSEISELVRQIDRIDSACYGRFEGVTFLCSTSDEMVDYIYQNLKEVK